MKELRDTTMHTTNELLTTVIRHLRWIFFALCFIVGELLVK